MQVQQRQAANKSLIFDNEVFVNDRSQLVGEQVPASRTKHHDCQSILGCNKSSYSVYDCYHLLTVDINRSSLKIKDRSELHK